MHDYRSAVFVFDSPTSPTAVSIYPNLAWARESLESLDVSGGGREPAFTAAGRVIRLEPSADLFAVFEVTEQVDLERLQQLLRQVEGPAELADDPPAYAQEWIRREELDARRPPFVPERVWSWFRRRTGSPSGPSHWPAGPTRSKMRMRLQKLDDSDWAWGRLRVAVQTSPGQPWVCEEIRQSQLPTVESRVGLTDPRDQTELSQQARTARREWGHEGGFAEWTPRLGVQRHKGDLLRDVSK